LPRLRKVKDRESLQFSATTGVTAGATRYLPSIQAFGESGPAESAESVMTTYLFTKAGVIRDLVCWCGAVAGAGESFVYTVIKNGVATSITVTISGATERSDEDTTNTVAVDVGDRISVQVVNSAGGASTTHLASLEFEM